jgi:hypothetical protein
MPDIINGNPTELKDLESQIEDIVDYPDNTTILRTNQVIVEIIEAIGLNAADISGLGNPYCEVKLKNSKTASPVFTQKPRLIGHPTVKKLFHQNGAIRNLSSVFQRRPPIL